jgi:hypothetical protein
VEGKDIAGALAGGLIATAQCRAARSRRSLKPTFEPLSRITSADSSPWNTNRPRLRRTISTRSCMSNVLASLARARTTRTWERHRLPCV